MRRNVDEMNQEYDNRIPVEFGFNYFHANGCVNHWMKKLI